jgi:hypothetical protein
MTAPGYHARLLAAADGDDAALAALVRSYDQADGMGNRICFDGQGYAPLDQAGSGGGPFGWVIGGYWWAGLVRSYWPGSEFGGFVFDGETSETFYPMSLQGLTEAGVQAQGATEVFLAD